MVREDSAPFRPGMCYEMIVRLVDSGTITRYTIIRGPSTGQLWTVARKTPGVAHLLGDCHHCDAKIDDGVTRCPACQTIFGAWLDRNTLGLPELRPLPGEPGALDDPLLSPAHPAEQPGFRPLSSDGLSAFVHTDTPEPQTEEPEEDDALPPVRAETAVSSFFDESLRAEVRAAKRQATRFMWVTVVAVLGALATFGVVLLGGNEPAPVPSPVSVPVVPEEEVIHTPPPAVEAPAPPPPPSPVEQQETSASSVSEHDLVAHLGLAADQTASIAARRDHLDRAESVLVELQAGEPDAGQTVRLEDHAETIDRLRERLAFDEGSE